MKLIRFLGAISSTMVLLSACTSSAPSSGGSSSGGSSTSGGNATSGGSSTSGGTTWKAAPDRSFGEMAAASAGNEGAIAYVESGAADTQGVMMSVVKLQRLDAAGAARGAAIELGTVASSHRPRLTLATDGGRYLACWDDESESRISCALAPVGEGESLPALSVVGAWPSLAYSAGAWTLAYGVPGHVAVARVASDGSAVGSPALFEVDQDAPPKALLAATPAGFALVSAPDRDSGQDVRVHLLDSAFSPIGAPIDLGMKLWIREAVAVAVNGATLAVSVSEPYGSHLFLLAGSVITSTHAIPGGGKTGHDVAVTGNGTSFGRLSMDGSPEVLTYSTIAGDELIATPLELPADGARIFNASTFALLKIDGNLLFAATAGQPQQDEIIVARVDQP